MRPHGRPAADSARGAGLALGLGSWRLGARSPAWGGSSSRVHFRASGSRRARLCGRLKPGEEVTGSSQTPSLTRRGGDRLRGRGTSVRRKTRGPRSARRSDWAGAMKCVAAPDRRRVPPPSVAGRPGRLCSGRHLTRPVLKHGPRSLTHARVRRIRKPEGAVKAKGWLVHSQAGSLPVKKGRAHRRPLSSPPRRWEGDGAHVPGPERW